MTHHDNTQPQALVRVWLRTTDRRAPLHAVWTATAPQPSASSADLSDGGALQCA